MEEMLFKAAVIILSGIVFLWKESAYGVAPIPIIILIIILTITSYHGSGFFVGSICKIIAVLHQK